jgi:Protein of unknown function (DUF4232)
MRKTHRTILTVGTLSAVAVTVAAAATASAGTAQRHRAAAASCTISDMQAQMYDAGLLGLGNEGLMLTLTNTTTRTCQVTGYPGLRMEDSAHQVLPTSVREGSTFFNDDPGPSVVELSPGERASAVVAWGNPPGGADVQPAFLRISLADSAGAFVRVPFEQLNVTNGRLNVTALAAHTPLQR